MKFIKTLIYLPFYMLSVLPMRLLYFFSDAIYSLVYYILQYRKKVVFNNLSKAFPEKNEREIRKISKRFYRHFCDIIFESLKTLTISKEEARNRLSLNNPEIIEDFLESGRNVLLYAAHQGNWELLVYLPLMLTYPSNTFYRPLNNRYFNGLILLIRERFGVRCVEEFKGYRTIIAQKNNPEVVMNCIIGDQSPRRKSAIHWCDFLNRKTAFYLGANTISKKTNDVVLFPRFIKIKRGNYQLHFDLIEEFPSRTEGYNIVIEYARCLENTIVQSPEMWLWSHRRWKLSEA
ncbi:lysophospholipid acyltransferase family protein [Maribacter polysiphoniae]|uniref:KDO2-lipid IV(A) lauroyltransferase n=2 Tax=Maribacter polysiphoniae TaxID=429344 RepID=A0A316DVV3_9FLAO|nr:lysophospholipid acyltransferase family protein [Maribacter polysiphoniae]MBD1262163.1 lysophospholipid acyltransferase family protein [Maribacter polysiphoniae]PWK21578.1 KDO2-lipid IV(A) lauroyltransferase [Maribacter polysiphoniae]